jgi:HlyD family secretion protein
VDNSDLSLRPGMTATASITVKEVHDALLVPNGALRFVPPARAKDGRKSQNGGSVLSRLFPRPRRQPADRKKSGKLKDDQKSQRVWILRDGQPAPLPVTAGATDGIFTEITSGSLAEGQELVVDIASAAP